MNTKLNVDQSIAALHVASCQDKTWTDDALWVADEFKIDRTTRVEIEAVLQMRGANTVTEDDIWRFIGGNL